VTGLKERSRVVQGDVGFGVMNAKGYMGVLVVLGKGKVR
jgi:hypothetical protein